MKNLYPILITLSVLTIILVVLFTTVPKLLGKKEPVLYYAFEDCMLQKSSKLLESFPRQCERIDEEIFVEDYENKAKCKTNNDCTFYDTQKGFVCCQTECPGPPGAWIASEDAVNTKWYEKEMLERCGPEESRNCPTFDFSNCPVYSPPLKRTRSLCIEGYCTKKIEE